MLMMKALRHCGLGYMGAGCAQQTQQPPDVCSGPGQLFPLRQAESEMTRSRVICQKAYCLPNEHKLKMN